MGTSNLVGIGLNCVYFMGNNVMQKIYFKCGSEHREQYFLFLSSAFFFAYELCIQNVALN